MASVTVALTPGEAVAVGVWWSDDISLGSVFSAGGQELLLISVQLYSTGPLAGRVSIQIGFNIRRDFTPAFEAGGRIIFTASDGEMLEVQIADADMAEPYQWIPTNGADVIAFVTHVVGLADLSATLTLTDDPAHPDRPAAPTVTGTDDSVTAVGVEPNGDPTSYDWRIKRTSSSVWANRLDQTSLTQTWTSLQPDTEYEVQFRATNSSGDSGYSLSGIRTTDMQSIPPADFTNIPIPVAGDEWNYDEIILYLIDNLNALHALVTGNVPGTTFTQNEVLIGDTGGALAGVDLPNGALLVGSNGTPVALAIGTNGQRLRVVNGVVSWVTP